MVFQAALPLIHHQYPSFTASTLLTGLVSTKFNFRRMFIVVGAFGIPAIFLLGKASALWQLFILTSAVWFLGGIGVSLVNIFTGLRADQESQGRWFSVISLTSPVGSLTGGFVAGRIVDTQGYAAGSRCLSRGIGPDLASEM